MHKKKLFLLGVIVLAAVCVTSMLYADGKWNILQTQDMEDIRDYNAIAFVSPKEGWVAGISALEMDNPGYIGHTRNGGTTWEKAEVDVKRNLLSIYFFDRKNGWVVGDEGMIVGTKDGGKRWEVQTSKVDNSLYGVHFVNTKTGYAVGRSETILKTENGGKIWKILRGGEIPTGIGDDPEKVFNAIQFIGESTGWVAGVFIDPVASVQEALIQKTTDGAKTWVGQPTNVASILKDIFFVDAANGWTVGEDGIILHTTNGGDSWEIQTSGTEEHLLSVGFVDKNVGWAVGGDRGVNVIIHTSDGGETWENQSVTDDPIISKLPVNDVFILDAGHVWGTGNNGMVVQYSK